MADRRYDLIVWDFNGTLLDDVDICIASVNTLLARRHLPQIKSVEAYHTVFGFPVMDYYKKIGFDFSKESYEAVAHEWVAEYRAREGEASLRSGMRPVLDMLAERGVEQAVLSATERGMLNEQLEHLGIRPYFSEVYGRDDIYAIDKTALGRTLRARRPSACILMIGDTVQDAATAKAGEFDCVLVAGGHQEYPSLLGSGFPVCESAETLLAFLSSRV